MRRCLIVCSIVILTGCAGPWIATDWYIKSVDKLEAEGREVGLDIGHGIYFGEGFDTLVEIRKGTASMTIRFNQELPADAYYPILERLQQYAAPVNKAKLELLKNDCREDKVCWSQLAHFAAGVTLGLRDVEIQVEGGV